MALPSPLSVETMAMPSRLRTLYQAPRPDIQINYEGPSQTYTTLDEIRGEAVITAPSDTHFDDIAIEFIGTSRTYVERMTTAAAVSGRSEAFHQFLKLQQPRLHRHYPDDNILKAATTYKFPFVFVVPAHLLPRVCQHRVTSPSLRDHHLQLPPSFGDRDADSAADVHDHTVPDMASIRYGVFVRISKTKPQAPEPLRISLATKARRVRIVPATPENPPLDVDGADSEYTMRREKPLKKGLLKGKLGTLVIEAAQPPSLRMPPSTHTEHHSTTMATINLRFDPIDESAPPPRLNSLATKLKILTYFASTARSSLPTKAGSLTDVSQGLHAEHISLPSRCLANVEWTHHHPSKPSPRRDSAHSTTSLSLPAIPAPSSTYRAQSFYTSRIPVPISLPPSKPFAPTFHTCLTSRVYHLKLELSVHNAGLGGTIDLRLPLQLLCEAPPPPTEPRSSRNASVADDATEADGVADDPDNDIVEGFFAPRTIRSPEEAFVGQSTIGRRPGGAEDAPPGYEPFAAAGFGASRAASVSVF